MSPNMVFGGGGGKSPMSRTDLRVVAIVIGLCVSVIFAWLGDQSVYKHKPESHFQAVLAYVETGCSYLVREGDEINTSDRIAAFCLAASFYFVTLSSIGLAVFVYIEVHIIEPLVIRRKMMYVRREKALMNKYDDGTL